MVLGLWIDKTGTIRKLKKKVTINKIIKEKVFIGCYINIVKEFIYAVYDEAITFV